MAYKKYITKNGKIYGPYVYHSKRVNGKVISEYRGQKTKEKRKRKIFLIILLLVLILSSIFWILLFKGQFTGRVIMDIEGKITEKELISGKINLILNEGELIPRDSKIIIENDNKTYKYELRDLFEENTLNGNFYLIDSNIQGFGEGYGMAGTKEEFPTIKFELEINSEGNSQDENSEEITNETEENITESENITNKEIIQENNTEEQTTETEEEQTTETEEEITIQIPLEKPEAEESTEAEEEITSPLTGNVVSNFVSLLTGLIVSEENKITGEVSKENEFIYTGISNKKVEIIKDSVKIDDKIISEDLINMSIIEDELIITTNYSISTKGFGEDYVGENSQTFQIDFTKLNITLKEGKIKIKFLYNNSEIFSFEEEITNESLQEIIETTPVEELAEELFNQTTNITIKEKIELNLSEEEKQIIQSKFDFPVVQTSVKSYRNKYLVVFTIGNYLMEKSYPNTFNNEELEYNINQDQILWLKDLIISFSEEIPATEPLDNLSKNYPIF